MIVAIADGARLYFLKVPNLANFLMSLPGHWRPSEKRRRREASILNNGYQPDTNEMSALARG